jgi:hypothetical protein
MKGTSARRVRAPFQADLRRRRGRGARALARLAHPEWNIVYTASLGGGGGGGGVALSWTAPTQDEAGNSITPTGYYVYAGPTSEDWTIGPQDTGSAATSYNWSHASLSVGSGVWYFWVRAYDAAGNMSAPSAFATKTL